MNPTMKKPYHGQKASNQLASAYFLLWAGNQESPDNEGNLLLESKTKSYKEEKKTFGGNWDFARKERLKNITREIGEDIAFMK